MSCLPRTLCSPRSTPARPTFTGVSIVRHRRSASSVSLEGLLRFGEQTPGRVWLEVMLVHGMNDTEVALHAIAACLDAVRPDQVHLMLPLRPAAEAWVRPPDAAAIERALSILRTTRPRP